MTPEARGCTGLAAGSAELRAALGESLVVTVRSVPSEALEVGSDLFHDPRFYRLHSSEAGRSGRYLTLEASPGGAVVGAGFALELAPGAWHSPGRGTFGGLQWLAPIPASVADRCYCALEDSIRAAGGRSLHIILPPESHGPAQDALTTEVLRARGFVLQWVDQNFTVAVTGEPLRSRMKPVKRYGLGRAQRQGVRIHPLPPGERPEAFRILATYKQRRGLPMTMDEADFNAMLAAIPGSLLWSGAFLAEALVGAAVTLRLSREIHAIAYLGHRPEVDNLTVQELLIEAAYTQAQQQSCRLLDFGIATERGVRNEGLITFKSRLGFTPGPRTTWAKPLVP